MNEMTLIGLFLLLFHLIETPCIGQERKRSEKNSLSYEDPVRLGKADLQKIQRRTGLDRVRCIRLLEYRREHGPIRSFYELHYLEGFSASTIQKLRERAIIGQKDGRESLSIRQSLRHIKGSFRLRWGRMLQRRVGYRNGSYRGPRDALKAQFQFEVPGILTAVGNFDKDAGEAWWDPPRGMGASIKVHQQLPLEEAIIGPLRTRSGGGLLLDNGGDFIGGMGPESGSLFDIEAHTGSPDRSTMSGIGTGFKLGNWRFGSLYSHKAWTARLDRSENGKEKVRTLYRNGLFRKNSRLRKSNAWNRRDLVAHLARKGKRSGFSASFHYGRASAPFEASERIRDLPSDRGLEEKGLELHYRGRYERERWSMSFALQADGSKAFTTAFSSRPHDAIYVQGRLGISGWGFDPFWSGRSRDGRPFVQSSLSADRVIAAGWRIGIESRLLYRKWPSYRRKAPGEDRSIKLEVVHTGKDQKRIEFGAEYEHRERDHRSKENAPSQLRTRRRLDFDLEAGSKLSGRIRNRILMKGAKVLDGNVPDGSMIAYDLIPSWEDPDIKIYARFAYFDAPSYHTSPYGYENDLLYAFSVRPYYRRGCRTYFLIRYGPSKALTVEAKFGSWIFRDPEDGRIGSGNAAIPGRFRSNVRFQLRGSF